MLNCILYITKNSIPLFFCLNFSSIVFLFGFIGIIWNFKNIIILLIFIELMFFAINLQFIFISYFSSNFLGYIYALLTLILAASESVIGITILIIFYRVNNSVKYESLTYLKN
jgi:NADH-quinone oxidoreductase subunit K